MSMRTSPAKRTRPGMDVSGKRRSTAALSPHRRSAIRTSPRCLEGERRRRRWFCLTGLRRGEKVFPATEQKLTQPQAGHAEARLPQVPAAGREREDEGEDQRATANNDSSRLTGEGGVTPGVWRSQPALLRRFTAICLCWHRQLLAAYIELRHET